MASVRYLAVIALVVSFMHFDVRLVGATDFARELVDRINAERIKDGLAPLVISGGLTSAAQQYASTLATAGSLSHVGVNGATPQQRDEAAGYTNWDFLGEDLAMGQTSAEQALASWLASPEHRANVLSPRARDIGIGYATQFGASAGTWWVADFGDRSGGVSSDPAARSLGTSGPAAIWTAPNGYPISGAWLAFLRSHGDVDVLGLPRSGATTDPGTGQLEQLFQRTVLELHPEYSPSFQIQRRLLGDIVYPGADPPVSSHDRPTATADYFPFSSSTPTGLGHFVANVTRTGQPTYFQDFFDSHGGVETFGYPKEEPKRRGGRWTQRFQAAVLEYHAEYDRDGFIPGTQTPLRQYRVQLELLGDEYLKARGIPFR